LPLRLTHPDPQRLPVLSDDEHTAAIGLDDLNRR
jgi:hypothetical protein